MKILKYIQSISFVLSLLMGLYACQSNFLDINTDPNNPTDAAINSILPGAQVQTAFVFANAFNNAGSTYAHQMVNFRVQGYATAGSNNEWNLAYQGALKDYDIIIQKATTAQAWHYAGIAKIHTAYIYSLMVDLFGNIPYTDALKGETLRYPKYDKDSDVYKDLFRLIDDGIADLAKTSTLPLANDLIYNGNLGRWKKAAKTLKLKMLNQIRLSNEVFSQTEIATQINALVTENDLITASADDFELRFGTSANPENRHPFFVQDYVNKGENWIDTDFYNRLVTANDPRIPYYFFRQTGNTFVAIKFANTAATTNDNNTRTLPGIYPAGGRFDNGVTHIAGGASASGNAPFRMLTNYMRAFILAEAVLTIPGVTGDARAYFSNAMDAAFAEVNVAANVAGASLITQGAIDGYRNARLAEYDAAANDTEKLRIIMTEKNTAMFGNGVEAYNDIRRTGFPALPDPNNDGDPNTNLTQPYPMRFPYGTFEASANPNTPKVLITAPIFWDK